MRTKCGTCGGSGETTFPICFGVSEHPETLDCEGAVCGSGFEDCEECEGTGNASCEDCGAPTEGNEDETGPNWHICDDCLGRWWDDKREYDAECRAEALRDR